MGGGGGGGISREHITYGQLTHTIHSVVLINILEESDQKISEKML